VDDWGLIAAAQMRLFVHVIPIEHPECLLDRITRLIDASSCPASLTSISRPELHEVSVSLTEQRSECRLTAAINAVDQVEAACSTVSTLKESQARRTLA